MSIVLPVPLFREKFKITNFSKTTGIVAGTPITVFSELNVKIIAIYLRQVNTTPQANNMDFTASFDGKVIEGNNIGIANNTPNSLYIGEVGAGVGVGTDPAIIVDAVNTHLFGLTAGDLGAAVYQMLPLKSGTFIFTANFDTIGVAQELDVDIYYQQKEAS